MESCRSASFFSSGAMPNDEPIRKQALDRPPLFACRSVSASCSEDSSFLRRQDAEKAALRELRADKLRFFLQTLRDLRVVRVLRQTALRQLDELEIAIGRRRLAYSAAASV